MFAGLQRDSHSVPTKVPEQDLLPASGTPSKTTRWATERGKTHESETGGWRPERGSVARHMACVRRQMSLFGAER